MTYLSFYLETDNNNAGLFLHSTLDATEQENLKISFQQCGGIRVNEHVTTGNWINKRLVISSWKSKEGYEQWLNHSLAQPYLSARNDHNLKYSIQSSFIAGLSESILQS